MGEVCIIPFLPAYQRRGSGKNVEEVCEALCGKVMVRYKDDGRYYNPEMADHRIKHGFGDNWCEPCLSLHAKTKQDSSGTA